MGSQEAFDFSIGRKQRGGRDLSIRSIQITVKSQDTNKVSRRSVKSWNFAGVYPERGPGVGKNARADIQEDLEGFKYYWLDLEDYTNKVFIVKKLGRKEGRRSSVPGDKPKSGDKSRVERPKSLASSQVWGTSSL
jgi:hypothetical protein